MFEISSLRIGPEKNFCYKITCKSTYVTALVDPSFDFDKVIKWATQDLPSPSTDYIKYLIATHGHWDHAGGFPEMLELLPHAKIVAHETEAMRLKQLHCNLDMPLKDQKEFKIGNVTVKPIHTPGHTEGGCCYLVGNYLISGDTLFVGQCGRTDLPGGSEETLFQSLQKLKQLPDETIVLPGHDYGKTPQSTIGKEKKTNPTMMASSFKEFQLIP